MIRRLLPILVVMTCAFLPPAAMAQQYGGDAGSGGPSEWDSYQYLGLFNPLGWLPGSIALTPPKLYAGYQWMSAGWKTGFTGPAGPFQPRWDGNIRNSAVWLGTEWGAFITDNLEARLRGWYVMPMDVQGGRENTLWNASDPSVSRSWWYADAVLAYHMSEWFSLIHGWRIDRDKAVFTLLVPGGPWADANYRAERDLSSTIPYVGVESRLWGAQSYACRLSVPDIFLQAGQFYMGTK